MLKMKTEILTGNGFDDSYIFEDHLLHMIGKYFNLIFASNLIKLNDWENINNDWKLPTLGVMGQNG